MISRIVRYILSVTASTVALCALNVKAIGQNAPILSWKMLAAGDGVWKYWDKDIEPDSAWRDTSFSDAEWSEGVGGIGYGNGDDRTTVEPLPTLCVRKKFWIDHADNIDQLLVMADFDDGFVLYLNGYEVLRYNMGDEYTPVSFYDKASAQRITRLSQGRRPEAFVLDPSQLRYAIADGDNVVAAEVHNAEGDTSGISALFHLIAGSETAQLPYMELPAGFAEPPVFSSDSDLPILCINTGKNPIVDDRKTTASMQVCYNGNGQRNAFAGPYLHYDGYIGVETRGQSSQEFPKKSLSIETRDAAGNNLNVPLLGMPAENDWVLYAPYTDKSLIRNHITYELWRRMGHYSVRSRFCELMINGTYQGVYLLAEKIKKDANRVDIATLKDTDTAGAELTGGYILKVDKSPVIGYNAWESIFAGYKDFNSITYQYVYPAFGQIRPEQEAYIQGFVSDLETELLSDSAGQYQRVFSSYIDKQSAMDKILITELSKDVDSYRYSQYMHKEKQTRGGLLKFGPLWDYDTGYGNCDYGSSQVWLTSGWVYGHSRERMFWFDRMMQDTVFVCDLAQRWHQLRSSVLSESSIAGLVDSSAAVLQESQSRNHFAWKTLGRYVWPNYFVAETYEEEIGYIKTWIHDRLIWMDSQLADTCYLEATGSQIDQDEYAPFAQAFPNPFDGHVSIAINGSVHGKHDLSIYTISGQLVYRAAFETDATGAGRFVWDGMNAGGEAVRAGLYLFVICDRSGNTMQGKLAKGLKYDH